MKTYSDIPNPQKEIWLTWLKILLTGGRYPICMPPNPEQSLFGVRGVWDALPPGGEFSSKAMISLYQDPNCIPHLAVDASLFTSGLNRCSELLNLVCNLAYNNGWQFEVDRMGLSKQGRIRAAELLLSSILKFQTSRHIDPAPNMLEEGPDGEPAVSWREGSDVWNIANLISVTYRNVLNAIPETACTRYNFDLDCFEVKDSNGYYKSTDNGFFENITDAPISRNSLEKAQTAGIGGTSFKRAVLVKTVGEYVVHEKSRKQCLLDESPSIGATLGRSIATVSGTLLENIFY